MREKSVESRDVRSQNTIQRVSVLFVHLRSGRNGAVDEPRFASDAKRIENEEGVVSRRALAHRLRYVV